MDKENVNRKRSMKGKVATERVQMGRSRGKKRKEKGKRLRGNNDRGEIWIKEKRQEMREEGCMERKVHIGNKWWKIMTIYSRDEDNKKTCRRRKERKQGKVHTLGRGL
jgi:hypothetical protein